MDRSRLSTATEGHADTARVRCGGTLRIPGPRGPIRELETAAGDRTDSTYVPACVRYRPDGPWNADRHPGTDRLHRTRRARREERHSDRRVCTPEGRGRDARR